MATNKVSEGNVLAHTAAGALSSGDIVQFGAINDENARIGIALTDIAAGAVGSLAISGVWTLPKATGAAVSQGNPVYLASGEVTETATGNYRCGYAAADAAAGDTTCQVLIDW